VITLYQTKWALGLVESLLFPSSMVKAVLNRADSRGGVDTRDVRMAIPCEVIGQIPSDGHAVGTAVNQGVPVVTAFSSTKVAAAFQQLADVLIARRDLYIAYHDVPRHRQRQATTAAQAAPANLGRDWAAVTAAVTKDLEAVFAQNQKYAGARGSQSVEQGKTFDDLVTRFQATHIKAIDDFARAAGTRAPGQKIDEYKAQLKAALVDMRGKDYAATNFTLGDLRIQFRLAVLEREIGDAVGRGPA